MATQSCLLPLSLFLFISTLDVIKSQISVGPNIFDSLGELGCNQFKNIIIAAKLEERYKGNAQATIFVFDDATFAALPPSRAGSLYENTERGPRNYVQSFTLDEAVETSSFSDAKAYRSELNRRGYLFLNKRQMLSGNVASGTPGTTRYFVNGAMIVKQNIKAGQHVIHIIDRVLDMPLEDNAISYADDGNPGLVQFRFYKELMLPLSRSLATDSEDNYSTQVRRVLQSEQVTFFLPTDAAMNEIPSQKLSELVGNPEKLMQIVTLHIVPGKVLFTSLVNHNELFLTQRKSGKVIFRKNFDKEAVFVTGARSGGGTVTARLSPANITVHNGVVHQIDQVLGFVYKTAREEVSTDVDTNNFERFINSASKTLQRDLSMPSGVTLFVPTNNAMVAIRNVYENYITNHSLINRVLQLSMLKPGSAFSLTSYNRGYRSMIMKESRYNSRMVKIYSEGNDTWVEGGYVRARVIKPDVGVTNGFVHIIDAVFGIPTRDMVYTIFCNDWLIRTYDQMVYVGLDKYMRDPTLISNQQCSFLSGQSGSSAGEPNNVNQYSQDMCGDNFYRCEFTFFIPNGTAIDDFLRRPEGQDIINEPKRFRWILRRLISRRQKIYIDQLALGGEMRYYADNGESVYIQTYGSNSLPSSQRTAYLVFENVRAEIIRSDIGASNGVIHIIDDVLFTARDMNRDISKASSVSTSVSLLVLLMLINLLLSKT